MNTPNKEPIVQLGPLQVTAEAQAKLTRSDIVTYLRRHERGDWGAFASEASGEKERRMRLMTFMVNSLPEMLDLFRG